MHAFAQQQNQPQQKSIANLTRSNSLTPAASHDAHPLLQLQRTIENQAGLQLLQAKAGGLEAGADEGPTTEVSPETTTTMRFAHDFSRVPVHAPAPITIQPKLAVNTPGDTHEQEADHISKQVMRMPEPKLQHNCACGGGCPRCQTEQPVQEHQRLQTKHGGSSESGQTAAPPIVEETLASGGGSLPGGLRADMEQGFGHDFGHVRLHTHAHAAESAAAVAARAYTVGPDVVFAAGEYAPDTDAGRRLIAHELAHVVQQDAGRAWNSRGPGIAIGAVDDPLEREAETAARRANEGAAPSIASASLSAGVGRVARAPVLQRDNGPGERKEETPIPRVPYREKAPPATGETEPEEGRAEEEGPTLALASAARPTCDPKGLARKDYLAEPNTSTDDFGLTRFAGTVRMALTTRKVKGGVMLEPLKVALPAITSVYTKADTFIEGTGVFVSQDRAECEGGKVPLQWRIFPPGAAKIREGEMEHCEDLQYAYDVTLGWYGQVVDDLIAKRRTFRSDAAAFKQLEKLTGTHPTGWPSVFECLAKKTEKRDGRKFTNAWHTPRVKALPPRLEDSCKFSRVFVTGAANFPELGKHPTPDVIKGCGESPGAVKALAAKAAAAKAAMGGEGQKEAEPGKPTPKTPEPPPKSTEPAP
jgi:Domain of unknown function (DUF4157)